ncbi:MAG: CRISPR-associated endonuclease Cas1 [Saprospiraceae bacterium]|nr:CRISPR-associated endonuclease Cas1 [Saprospiraceae bacterium]
MQLHLNTYGAYLHVKDAMFDVRKKRDDGTIESKTLAAHKVQSIWLGRGTSLSSDAVRLALMHNVDIVFLENNGQPLGRVWHSKLGSTTRIRKCQLEASLDERCLQWVKTWLGQKVEGQSILLRDLKKHRPQYANYLDDKLLQIADLQQKIAALAPAGMTATDWGGTMQGLEGTAGRLYFETLSQMLLPAWQFQGRSKRPAQDAFNAFLNYAYGVLYARVEKALMLAGLDPYVGFMHRDDYNHKSLVFDFIEPYRHWADKAVFTLFAGKKVNQSCVDIVTGGVSMNKQGKEVLMTHYNEYLEGEIIRYKGRNRTRASILLLDAHAFAQSLLGSKDAVEMGEVVEL